MVLSHLIDFEFKKFQKRLDKLNWLLAMAFGEITV